MKTPIQNQSEKGEVKSENNDTSHLSLPTSHFQTLPATETVVNALTAKPPVVLGRELRPVTIAHVIALEMCGCQLVLFERRAGVMDNLVAAHLLSLNAAEALKAAQDPAAVTAAAEALALAHGPEELLATATATQGWLNAAYEPHIPVKGDGGESPLDESSASDGQPA
jgi:hypothetical protein